MSSLLAVAAAFAVVGEIIAGFVSASQIDKFLECERMWAWRYIARIKDDSPRAAADFGTECDETQLQPYLRDGRAIDYSRRSGYVVQPGLAFLPKPQAPGIELQRHFVMPGGQRPVHDSSGVIGYTVASYSFQGFVDLWVPDASVMPDLAYDPKQGPRVLEDGTRPPVVDDFKTTGNWKYLKTPKILETDTQAQIYAKWAMWMTGAPVIDLIWTTFATKGAYRAKRSHLRVTREHVDEQFARIDAVAAKIHAHRKRKTNPLELLPNVDACDKYFGCPYQANCNLSPTQKIEAKAAQHARQQKEIETMSNAPSTTAGTLAALKARKAAALGTPAPATPPPAPEVTKAGIPVANLPSHAKPSLMGCAPEDVPAPTEIPAKFLGINPPEKDLPPAPAVGSVPVPAEKTASADTTSNVSEPVPAKRGPGRPRKPPVDPVGADIAMHTAMATAGEELVQALDKMPAPVTDIFNAAQPGETVRVVWAEETLCPVAYNPFKVGPFEATGFVRAGETISQASARIYAELVSFAEEARTQKAISFKATLDAIGGGR